MRKTTAWIHTTIQTLGAHLCWVLPLIVGDGHPPSETDLAHWAKTRTWKKCSPVRWFRQIEWYHVKMSLYSDPQRRYTTRRAFLWVGVHTCYETPFWRSFLGTPRYISPSGQRYERGNWYARYRSFQSWDRCWNSEIPLRKEFVQLPPCNRNDLHINKWLWDRTRIVCAQDQGTGLGLYNHSDLTAPSYMTKLARWGKTAKQPRPWPYAWAVINFTFAPIPFSHTNQIPPDFFTPDSHFITISSRNVDYHILNKLIFKKNRFFWS